MFSYVITSPLKGLLIKGSRFEFLANVSALQFQSYADVCSRV